jgi:hypothetical protein
MAKKQKLGDCYQAAGSIALNGGFRGNKWGDFEFQGTPYVVHAEVSGQGAIAGLRYGHAWVEDNLFVYDFSNKRELIIPKELFYTIGNVNVKDKTKYRKYTFQQARKKMLDTGHYGAWDIITEF